ncbi:MAG: hypothetical protein WKF84_02780 [Pyrinomonadaceae bacterium]
MKSARNWWGCRNQVISEIIGSDEQPTIATPDHLLRLVQQVQAHYLETNVKSKAGRPRTYSGLSFLLLAVVAVTLRTFKGLELHRLLEKDARLRNRTRLRSRAASANN